MIIQKGNPKYVETYCSGCGLCHAMYGCELKENSKGFPVVVNGDREELYGICPVFYYEGRVKHDVWGTIEKAYVGYSSDERVRFKAASGGALTELCVYLLESKKVTGIIHTTYDPQDQTKTISCVSYTADEVRTRCGSRYSISMPLYDLKRLMKDGESYAFVGKPCDVMALRRGIAVDPSLGEKIKYLLSFFCAGEPSVDAQNDLLNAIGTSREKFSAITYRGNGWPGYTTVTEKDGNILKMEYKNAWGKYLGRDIRNLCRFCIDGTGDAADIVCADFWYLGADGSPDFSEHEGRSIVITRTNKGTTAVEETVNAGRLFIEEDFTTKIDTELHLYQPNHYKRKCTMRSMLIAMKICRKHTPGYGKEYLKLYSSHLGLKVKLRFFFGTLKRIVRGRI